MPYSDFVLNKLKRQGIKPVLFSGERQTWGSLADIITFLLGVHTCVSNSNLKEWKGCYIRGSQIMETKSGVRPVLTIQNRTVRILQCKSLHMHLLITGHSGPCHRWVTTTLPRV